jgi:hypothetical protein
MTITKIRAGTCYSTVHQCTFQNVRLLSQLDSTPHTSFGSLSLPDVWSTFKKPIFRTAKIRLSKKLAYTHNLNSPIGEQYLPLQSCLDSVVRNSENSWLSCL